MLTITSLYLIVTPNFAVKMLELLYPLIQKWKVVESRTLISADFTKLLKDKIINK